MSFTFDLIINPIVLALAGIVGIVIGYIIAKGRLAKAQSKIKNLEEVVPQSMLPMNQWPAFSSSV